MWFLKIQLKMYFFEHFQISELPFHGKAATLSSPFPSLRSLLWSPTPPPLSGSNSLKMTGDLERGEISKCDALTYLALSWEFWVFLLKLCLFCAIVDTDKITRIPSELITENSPACVIFLFFIENGAFAICWPGLPAWGGEGVLLLFLRNARYVRVLKVMCRPLFTHSRKGPEWKKELLGEVNGDNRFAHVHSVHCTHS